MATERGFVAPPVSSLRKIMKPVISTDVMGNRNVEVKAVGARAEPALVYSQVIYPAYSDAVRAAEVEEEKIRVMQEKKAARLKQFQEDVKKRVRQINKTKRKQQLENDYQSMEKHLNQVRSSLRAADCLTERKDRLVSHSVPVVSVRPSETSGASRLTDKEEEDLNRNRQNKVFEKHNHQVHTFTSEARKKLSNRKVEADISDFDDVAVGKWITCDTVAEPVKLPGEPFDSDEDEADDDKKCERNEEENRERADSYSHGLFDDQAKHYTQPRTVYSTRDDKLSEKENEDEDEAEKSGDENPDEEDAAYQARLQRVKFNLRTVGAGNTVHSVRKVPRKKGSHSSRRPTSAPDLRAGATEYAERRRQEQQKLNYRRLYSDLERQAVRDNQRRKKQRSQIQKIKKEKEELRRQEEDNARRLLEPRDPVTGETSMESNLRQQMERSHLEEVLLEREEKRQRQREMIRYLDALRNNLREKLSKQRLELPALCCCGETLWDTHPDTCANNCFYYKNHRAYARALQSLLTSSEIV